MKRITNKGFELIKRYESLQLKAYICPAGKKTIGYGHVILDSDELADHITVEIANQLLQEDCKLVESCLNKSIEVNISSNQFDALASLVFNVGRGAFKNSVGLLYLNHGNYVTAAEEFFDKNKGFVRAGGSVMAGLVRRREEEYQLWLS